MYTDYPIGLTTPPILGEDRAFYHNRLIEESARLFRSPDELDIEVLRLREGKQLSRRLPGTLNDQEAAS